MTTYVDTSGLLKLLFLEAETPAVRTWFAEAAPADLVSSLLIRPEAHCAARRRGPWVGSTSVDAALGLVDAVDLLPADLEAAAGGTRRLRAADAIHLATAERLGVDAMLVFDVELATAATAAGIRVVAPR